MAAKKKSPKAAETRGGAAFQIVYGENNASGERGEYVTYEGEPSDALVLSSFDVRDMLGRPYPGSIKDRESGLTMAARWADGTWRNDALKHAEHRAALRIGNDKKAGIVSSRKLPDPGLVTENTYALEIEWPEPAANADQKRLEMESRDAERRGDRERALKAEADRGEREAAERAGKGRKTEPTGGILEGTSSEEAQRDTTGGGRRGGRIK